MSKHKRKGASKIGRDFEGTRKRKRQSELEDARERSAIQPNKRAKYATTPCTPKSQKQKSTKKRSAVGKSTSPNIPPVQLDSGCLLPQQPLPDITNDQSVQQGTPASQQAYPVHALAKTFDQPPDYPPPSPNNSLAIKLMRQPSPPLEAIIVPTSPPHIRIATSLVVFLHSRCLKIQSSIDQYTNELDAARRALSSTKTRESESAVDRAAERVIWLEEAASSSLMHWIEIFTLECVLRDCVDEDSTEEVKVQIEKTRKEIRELVGQHDKKMEMLAKKLSRDIREK